MKTTFLKCRVDNLTMEQVLNKIKRQIRLKKPLSHICLNVDSVVRANRDNEYLKIINQAGLVTFDGMPLVMFSRLLKFGTFERVSGPDLFDRLLVLAQKNHWKVSFVGGEEKTIQKVRRRIEQEYPEIRIGFVHNGYWKEKEEAKVVEGIANSKSDILFLALGAPKQDWFITKNLEKFKVGFALGVGGCFDIFAGYKKRAPRFIQNAGLEWLYRFMQEPKRLFRRYFIYDLKILALLTGELYRKLFSYGHPRSREIKKNVISSLIFQVMGVSLGFLTVPITLRYLGKSDYGIFLTLSSLVGWLVLVDFGFGHGLRNRLAEALSRGQNKIARSYVSTAYAGLILLFGSLYLLFFIANHYLNWSYIIGAPQDLSNKIHYLSYFVFGACCLQFVLNLLNTVITANQKPALTIFLSFISSFVTLVGIFILSLSSGGDLIKYGLTVILSPVLVYLAASIIMYSGRFKNIAPKLEFVNFKFVKGLLNLGLQFFVIQLTMIVIFQTDYLVISHVLGPSEVVAYNIVYKYFGLVTSAFGLVVLPFWSATTEAFAKNDLVWIRRAFKGLRRSFILFFLLSVLLLAISPWFYNFWLKGLVKIPLTLSIAMFVYAQLLNWGSVYVVFINGIGRIKTQLIVASIGALVNIPLSIFLAKYLHLGSAGIIIATSICILYGYAIAPFQFKKLIQGKL